MRPGSHILIALARTDSSKQQHQRYAQAPPKLGLIIEPLATRRALAQAGECEARS